MRVPLVGWESLALQASLATYLADYREKLRDHGDSDPILQPIRRNPRPKGTNPRRWFETCQHVRKVFEKAGLAGKGKPVGLHPLRHSYCTNLIRSGAGVEELRQLAGHSSIVVSQRYLWSDSRSRRAAAEAMFDMVRNAHQTSLKLREAGQQRDPREALEQLLKRGRDEE